MHCDQCLAVRSSIDWSYVMWSDITGMLIDISRQTDITDKRQLSKTTEYGPFA